MSGKYQEYQSALKEESSPALLLDLEALEANISWAVKNAGEKKIRIATKSVRCAEVLRKILDSSPAFQGLMTFTLREALWLRKLGFKDLLMGYPTTDISALQELARNPREITLMVDLPEHIDILDALKPQGKFSICLDLDLSMDLPGVRFGVYRSQLRGPEQLRKLLDRIEASKAVELKGLMGYEAQVAGIGDDSLLMRTLKELSVGKLRKRRAEVHRLIEERGHKLTLVNGGGTGSLDTTREESCITEVTVGSGFYAPALFDHYDSFKLTPALLFSLPIVRRPAEDIVTCLGGGYIASGALEETKLPLPFLPAGLSLLKHEGAGEVQTPLKGEAVRGLSVGDLIFMRHAKAGEPCERFNEILFVRSGKVVGRAPTYRGEGKAFL